MSVTSSQPGPRRQTRPETGPPTESEPLDDLMSPPGDGQPTERASTGSGSPNHRRTHRRKAPTTGQSPSKEEIETRHWKAKAKALKKEVLHLSEALEAADGDRERAIRDLKTENALLRRDLDAASRAGRSPANTTAGQDSPELKRAKATIVRMREDRERLEADMEREQVQVARWRLKYDHARHLADERAVEIATATAELAAKLASAEGLNDGYAKQIEGLRGELAALRQEQTPTVTNTMLKLHEKSKYWLAKYKAARQEAETASAARAAAEAATAALEREVSEMRASHTAEVARFMQAIHAAGTGQPLSPTAAATAAGSPGAFSPPARRRLQRYSPSSTAAPPGVNPRQRKPRSLPPVSGPVDSRTGGGGGGDSGGSTTAPMQIQALLADMEAMDRRIQEIESLSHDLQRQVDHWRTLYYRSRAAHSARDRTTGDAINSAKRPKDDPNRSVVRIHDDLADAVAAGRAVLAGIPGGSSTGQSLSSGSRRNARASPPADGKR